MTDLDAARTFAEELADGVRELLRARFRSLGSYEIKADATPVTAADREVESWLRARIRERYPDHGIRGEEEGPERLDADLVWVLDPIDGTKSFATGRPLFVSLIALVERGTPVLGIIEAPATGERWVGQRGRVTTFQGGEVAVAPDRPLDESVVYTTSPDLFEGHQAAAWERLRRSVRYACYGGDGYLYGMLANGDIDLVVEAGLAAYDVAALIPVVEGAGGSMTGWDGGPLPIGPDVDVVAASSAALSRAAREALGD